MSSAPPIEQGSSITHGNWRVAIILVLLAAFSYPGRPSLATTVPAMSLTIAPGPAGPALTLYGPTSTVRTLTYRVTVPVTLTVTGRTTIPAAPVGGGWCRVHGATEAFANASKPGVVYQYLLPGQSVGADIDCGTNADGSPSTFAVRVVLTAP